MKIYKKNRILILLAILGMVSCTHFEDMNVSPNRPTTVPTSGLLTQAQVNLVYTLNGEVAHLGAQYVQHFTQVDYVEKSNYADDGKSSFLGIYAGGLRDLKEIIVLNTQDRTKEEVLKYGDNDNQIAVANILQVWAFHNMTDIWGDIPYSEALKGNEGIIQPKYDTQEAIYDGLIAQLETASEQIILNPEVKLEGDIIFDGNMNQWEQFAVSLKLRIAMRLSEVNNAKADELINDADFANA
ncbi:MAG: SusD/RagB family nutrient-binding outer membrane lipoprotein, partial [Bacteroidota bacterium]